MSDIELVIKMPEAEYNIAKYGQYGNINVDVVRKAIADGTPLPKHHGRLIDEDKVLDDIEKQYPASVSEIDKCKRYARLVYYWAVKNAPTIIEADKEGDNEADS